MRKTLIIVFVTTLVYYAYSQDKWAPVGTEWYYSLPNELGNPLYSYEKFISIKDTVIMGKQCKIIKSPRLIEFMYEDNNKVYYLFGNEFKLIYDFAANIGDTIGFDFKSYTPNSIIIDTTYNINCVVKNIDTLWIDNKEIREFYTTIIPIDSLDHIVWPSVYNYRERIGYEYEFMFVLSIPTLGFMHNLRCFNDGELNYVTDWWKAQNKPCDFSLSTSLNNSPAIEDLIIFPNPILDEITINTTQLNYIGNYKVVIFDNAGKKVFEEKINSQSQKLNVNALLPGIYYLSIYNNNLFYKPFKIVKL